MAFIQDFSDVSAPDERARRAWKLPVGAVSPLWAVFGAAAGAGVAYWWMTRWTRAASAETLWSADLIRAPKPAATRIEIISEASPEPLAEAAPELAAASPDDLTRMVGIGPKLSEALAARGVTRFAQIAAWTAEDLAEIDAALGLKGRAGREAWVAQAKRLAAEV